MSYGHVPCGREGSFGKIVHNENLLFLLTCMAGIGLAVAFSYLGKKVIVRYSRL